jgi:hypothetical protein
MREYESINPDVIANHFKEEQEFFYFRPSLLKPIPSSLIEK